MFVCYNLYFLRQTSTCICFSFCQCHGGYVSNGISCVGISEALATYSPRVFGGNLRRRQPASLGSTETHVGRELPDDTNEGMYVVCMVVADELLFQLILCHFTSLQSCAETAGLDIVLQNTRKMSPAFDDVLMQNFLFSVNVKRKVAQ